MYYILIADTFKHVLELYAGKKMPRPKTINFDTKWETVSVDFTKEPLSDAEPPPKSSNSDYDVVYQFKKLYEVMLDILRLVCQASIVRKVYHYYLQNKLGQKVYIDSIWICPDYISFDYLHNKVQISYIIEHGQVKDRIYAEFDLYMRPLRIWFAEGFNLVEFKKDEIERILSSS